MNIKNIDRLVKAVNDYTKRKDDLYLEPSNVDMFEDKALLFHATKLHSAINDCVDKPEPKKKSKKKS